MTLTDDQLQAAKRGGAVPVQHNGETYYLLSEKDYFDQIDYSPWTKEEIDLLADEAAEFAARGETTPPFEES